MQKATLKFLHDNYNDDDQDQAITIAQLFFETDELIKKYQNTVYHYFFLLILVSITTSTSA